MPRIISRDRFSSAELKLLRSVFTKGLTALLAEALTAAHRCGVDAELERTLAKFMENDFQAIAELLLGSTFRHARRRADEMEDVGAFVTASLGNAPMTTAIARILRAIADLEQSERSHAATLAAAIQQLDSKDLFNQIG